ncbi:MerR family transcriptional regulator [Virgibacillus ndiopensis]|uniref:MerR family transcriptional regulator n=1 Tax=Virgibacillus ndiopensis TaxID=2004408 RepID=UPI000C06E52B|nr:MerR family transcriptional regulator [Virgibacillus ndiopensis]
MKIGEFIKEVKSTKDTVRHYEEVGMIQPDWQNNRRIYTEKDIQDFHAIKEMQKLGLSLKEIHLVFEIKRNNGCGSSELLAEITEKMVEKQQQILIEERTLKRKKDGIKEMLELLSGITAYEKKN